MKQIPWGFGKKMVGRTLLSMTPQQLEQILDEPPVSGCGYLVLGQAIHKSFALRVLIHKLHKANSRKP
jgi:hypothetical protein